jgi:hypothetical protein
MPKRTKKLLVYLDQNFISEMAKAKVNERVKREFKEVYELLHTGFIEEKLVVPQSWFHDVETSLLPQLKERIVSYQNYLGQVELNRPDEVSNAQVAAALQRFLGDNGTDALSIETAFRDHPDQRVQRFNITVDMHLERRDYKTDRTSIAQAQEALRQGLLQKRTTYEAQVENEYNWRRDLFLKNALQEFAHLCKHPREELLAFANSSDFRTIPVIGIGARLYAAILTKYPTRQIKASDATDVEILSTYLPYMDVLCTDAFMADQLRTLGIHKEHQVAIFNAKTTSLNAFKAFLEDYLKNTPPVHRPTITVFVLPSHSIKKQAFKFFLDLGAAAREFGTNEYAEIYAFDDGRMPQYELPQMPNHPIPFYGLQEVRPIELRPGTSNEEILTLCRAHCRSNKFVLIEEYQEIPKLFLLGVIMRADAGIDTTGGCRIYTKNP